MLFAAKAMGCSGKQKITSRLYAILKSDFAEVLSKKMTGIPRSKETIEKIIKGLTYRFKPVKRIDIKTGAVKEYESIRAASREGFNVR